MTYVMSPRELAFQQPGKKRLAKRAKMKVKHANPHYGNRLKSFMGTGVSFRPNVSGFQVLQSNLGGKFK